MTLIGAVDTPQGSDVSQHVHVTVADVDRHVEHAKQSGARIVRAPADKPFGERQYTAQDHAGHWWTFSQHVADVDPNSAT